MAEDLLYEEDIPERKGRGKKTAVIVLCSALGLMVAAVAVVALYLNSLRGAYEGAVNVFPEDQTFPEEEERPDRPTREEEDDDGNVVDVDDEQINILLIGSDEGGGSGEFEDVPWLPNAGRADTMMWVHIPHERDAAYVMSMMRDTWVDIPGHGNAKVNASLTLGGPEVAVATMESLFNTRIDHVASVDMIGFQNLVGAMGGVTVNSPLSFTSWDGHHFHGGEQHMSESEAMSFVRERSSFSDGDYQRVENQQAFMRGVLNDVLTPSTLSNPARVHDMVTTFTPHMGVDSELGDAGYVADLAWSMRDIRGGDIDTFTVPNDGVGTTAGQSVIWPDYDAMEEAGEAMREGTFDEFAAQH